MSTVTIVDPSKPAVPPTAPATPAAGATPPAAAPAAPPATEPATPVVELQTAPQAPPDPTWIKGRLDQAERAAISKLGVKDAAEAKALIDRARALEEAEKTALQRASEQAAAAAATSAELGRYKQTVTDRAARELATLTAEQQAVVKQLAGEDAASILNTIDTLKPTWVAAAVTATPATPAPAGPRPIGAPASTSAAVASPAPVVAQPENNLETWDRLKQAANPLVAAAYYNKHAAVINGQIEARRNTKKF